MCKKVFLALLISTFLLLKIQSVFAEPQKEITVSVAISLKEAFEEIGRLYESKDKGSKVVFNFGGSGDLAGQIEGGAPVDIFTSAASKDMDDLDGKGLIVPGTKVNFAGNTIVLIKPANSKIQITSFEDLKKTEVSKIAIGNIKTVPIGRYAEEVLRYYSIFDSLKQKFVFAENTRQVLDYVGTGEVDAGIVYSTDVLARVRMAQRPGITIIGNAPSKSHEPVRCYIGVVKGTKNERMARTFIKMVSSQEGKKILKKHGFETNGK